MGPAGAYVADMPNPFSRLFSRAPSRTRMIPLYNAVVGQARDPAWYRTGGVPDTLDGRFDTVATVLALVLLRLEAEGESARAEAALLAELFVDDMDGQLRQSGIGDLVVGKHVGRMMGMLGGKCAAYREALGGGDLEGAVSRNLHRGEDRGAAALADAAAQVRELAARLARTPLDRLLAGEIAQ